MTGRTPIVVWGAGAHSRTVTEIIQELGTHDLVGLIDSLNPKRCGERYHGHRVLGGSAILPRLRAQGVLHATVAVGDGPARLDLAAQLAEAGFESPALVHPTAIVSSAATTDPGTVVGAGAILQASAHCESFAYVGAGAIVAKDVKIGQGATVTPGAILGRNVTVGACAHVGLGAQVREEVRIGRRAVVGMGATVLRDVIDGTVVYGSPASPQASRSPSPH